MQIAPRPVQVASPMNGTMPKRPDVGVSDMPICPGTLVLGDETPTMTEEVVTDNHRVNAQSRICSEPSIAGQYETGGKTEQCEQQAQEDGIMRGTSTSKHGNGSHTGNVYGGRNGNQQCSSRANVGRDETKTLTCNKDAAKSSKRKRARPKRDNGPTGKKAKGMDGKIQSIPQGKGNKANRKGEQGSDRRKWSEEEDLELIAFWHENYARFSTSQLAEFAKRAAVVLNRKFEKAGKETVNKNQIRNKLDNWKKKYSEVCLQMDQSGFGVHELTKDSSLKKTCEKKIMYFSILNEFLGIV